jgi:steroid 5-alpha reductase family enzyme
MWHFVLYSSIAVFVYMTCIFFVALLKRDNSVVDIAWGIGFILVSLLTFFLERGFFWRHILVTGLVGIWGMRLALYIYVRNKGRGEDFRYAQWRKKWGKLFILRSYLQVFVLQGIMLLIISYPIMLVNQSGAEAFSIWDAVGGGIWLIGFSFEAAGDFQLMQFKKDPGNKGKIMTAGLWRLTRHPNYFGETALWWGIFLIALSVKNGWTAVISPVLITFLLLRVSGVAMLERKYAGNQEFMEYARRTSPFFPWFPRKKSRSD